MKLSQELESTKDQLIFDHWGYLEMVLRTSNVDETTIGIRKQWYVEDAEHFFGHWVEEALRVKEG